MTAGAGRRPTDKRAAPVPSRILLVDDDELCLTTLADRLGASGYEIVRASNGSEALAALERQWFPVVITDMDMPVIDGIALVERGRAHGLDGSYVIMLTGRDDAQLYERGYRAGVDDYLSKATGEVELMARVRAGFDTVAVRRALAQTRTALHDSSLPDPEAGACDTGWLRSHLRAAIQGAQQACRPLSVLVLSLHNPSRASLSLEPGVLATVVHTVRAAIRMQIDWIARLDDDGTQSRFAIVLSETGPEHVDAIRRRLREAISRCIGDALPVGTQISLGASSLDAAVDRAVDGDVLLDIAERCRRCVASGGEWRLQAVQASITGGTALACRRGYDAGEHCLELAAVATPGETQRRAG